MKLMLLLVLLAVSSCRTVYEFSAYYTKDGEIHRAEGTINVRGKFRFDKKLFSDLKAEQNIDSVFFMTAKKPGAMHFYDLDLAPSLSFDLVPIESLVDTTKTDYQ